MSIHAYYYHYYGYMTKVRKGDEKRHRYGGDGRTITTIIAVATFCSEEKKRSACHVQFFCLPWQQNSVEEEEKIVGIVVGGVRKVTSLKYELR